MTGARWQLVVHDDAEQLARATADRLIDALGRAVDARGSADVVLTGGGIGVSLLRALAERPSREAVDWGQVRFWWGDERFLPSPTRNATRRPPEPHCWITCRWNRPTSTRLSAPNA